MFGKGYRQSSLEQNKTAFEFLRQAGFSKDLTNYFDTIRKKRHVAVYDIADTISQGEAENALLKAELFIKKKQKSSQKRFKRDS